MSARIGDRGRQCRGSASLGNFSSGGELEVAVLCRRPADTTEALEKEAVKDSGPYPKYKNYRQNNAAKHGA